MPTLSRRALLGGAAGLLAAAPAWADAQPQPFTFPLLGDLHFDRPEHHDMDWLAKEHPGDVRQVEEYSRITRDAMPGLFAEVREQVAAANTRVPFVLHVGDLVEGLCGTPELARRQNEEALRFVSEARLGAPLVMTKGNHDVTGPGAAEAYDRVLLPAATGTPPADISNYSATVGNALFLFYDAYRPGALDWLEKALENRIARHVFLVIHPPVVPYNARSSWHVFAKAAQAPQRGRLLSLLGKHRAIVLSGHLHKYACVVRQTDAGPFVQLAVSSVLYTRDGKRRDELSGLERYGADLVDLEPAFDVKSTEERRELLKAEKPQIRHWDYADTSGYAMVSVGGDQVRAGIYTGLGKRLWKTVDLTALLAG